VHFLQNHDQVGNRALGNRLHTMIDQSCHRVLTEILMLSPQIPLLFMGDDHLTMRKFLFFADYKGELAKAIAAGRSTEAENFGGLPDGCGAKDLPDPNDLSTFLDSKLDWDADDQGSAWTSFLKRLIKVRRNHVIPLLPDADGYAGSVVSAVEQGVFLDWKLGARTLQLRANASGRAMSMEGDFGHRVYPPVNEAAEEVLQPWTTHMYVL
jgi:1,4-alpha-glucan branching enzyme